jgi:hypothetical protein
MVPDRDPLVSATTLLIGARCKRLTLRRTRIAAVAVSP